MTVDDVIADFATAGHTLPVESMRWALDHWDEAAPSFIGLMEQAASQDDLTDETAGALFFIVHLLGEKHEAAGFGALCRLLKEDERSRHVLSDAITATLPGILINMYGGDPAPLKALIEADTADEFARNSALQAMAYLTRAGRFSDDEMKTYLATLRREMQPQADCYAWTGWVDAVGNLGYRDLREEARAMIEDGHLPARTMDVGHLDAMLARAEADPQGFAGFDDDRVTPFDDAIGELSKWHGFSEAARRARAEKGEALDLSVQQPYVNPLRHVGRNDPCPCGSGKKYKKCCLA